MAAKHYMEDSMPQGCASLPRKEVWAWAFRTGHSIGAMSSDLLAALQWREQFELRDGEDSNDRFERIAKTFRHETGYLRPGKSCLLHDEETRQAAWDEWMNEGRARVRAAIAAATGESS